MTTYHLNLTMAENPPVDVAAPPAARPSRILASLVTEDEKTMAATLHAVADRLDPPKPPRPVMRGRSGPIDFEDPAVRGAVVRVEPWMRRQAATQVDAPMYAHDPDCNTLHDGPDPCPPPVTIEALTPAAAEVVARVDADRARATARELRDWERCTEEAPVAMGGQRCTGRRDPHRLTIDRLRLEHYAPQADGTTAVWVTPVMVDVQDTPPRPRRSRRSRITPDGCGPEHTFTGSCAYAQQGRTD